MAHKTNLVSVVYAVQAALRKTKDPIWGVGSSADSRQQAFWRCRSMTRANPVYRFRITRTEVSTIELS